MTMDTPSPEELTGRQFALQAMVTHLLWTWAMEKDQPQLALAGFFRPLERMMADLAASQPPENAAIQEALHTVRETAHQLDETLSEEALRRTDGKGPVQ